MSRSGSGSCPCPATYCSSATAQQRKLGIEYSNVSAIGLPFFSLCFLCAQGDGLHWPLVFSTARRHGPGLGERSCPAPDRDWPAAPASVSAGMCARRLCRTRRTATCLVAADRPAGPRLDDVNVGRGSTSYIEAHRVGQDDRRRAGDFGGRSPRWACPSSRAVPRRRRSMAALRLETSLFISCPISHGTP